MSDESPVILHPAARSSSSGSLPPNLGETEWSKTAILKTVYQGTVPAAKSGADTDASVSLASKQLKTQIDECILVYDRFYQLYEQEVANIRPYANDDVLQSIWEQKIEHNEKFNTGQDEEHGQLSTQRKMLAACLSFIDAAVERGASRRSAEAERHDRRGVYLEKIRATGRRVLDLAEKTMSNSAVWEDFRSELVDLGNLVDPNGKDAKLIYRFDQRKTLKADKGKSDSSERSGDGQADGGGDGGEKQADKENNEDIYGMSE